MMMKVAQWCCGAVSMHGYMPLGFELALSARVHTFLSVCKISSNNPASTKTTLLVEKLESWEVQMICA
jgi:hypothetical protein